MTPLQEDFLTELKSNPKFTVAEYAALYGKHSKIAIADQEEKGGNEFQAKSMGNYYTVSVLTDFINSDNKLNRILAHHEADTKYLDIAKKYNEGK